VIAASLLAGCTTAERVPLFSAQPMRYAPQRAPHQIEPLQETPIYVAPAPRLREVPADPIPNEASVSSRVARAAPAPAPVIEPADPCVGWWRLCHFYE
jgi:hypothetical protein